MSRTGVAPWPRTGHPIIDSSPRARLACERVAAVLDGRLPDRVPFIDSYWSEFGDRYVRERGLAPDADLALTFDHDLVLVTPLMGPWPGGARVLRREAGGFVITRDEYGLILRSQEGWQAVPQHLEARIGCPADLERYPFEDPADPARFVQMETRLPHLAARFCPVLKLGGPFSRTWRLRGLQVFLEDLAGDPAFAREMVGRMTDHLIAVGLAAIRRMEWPRIQLHIADDFASTAAPLFSPRIYEQVFLPSLKRMVSAFHREGFRVSYESEGNVYPMLDLLDASGVDGLAHMEPRAGMSIQRIRERMGRRFFILGNVCNTVVLPSNQRAAVAREVLRVLRGAADGGYMGLSAHSISPDVSSDTYDYFFRLMDRYGRCPADLGGLEREIARL